MSALLIVENAGGTISLQVSVALVPLFENDSAILAIPEGISVPTGETVVHVAISDTGPGIEEKDLHRMFQKFTILAKVPRIRRGTGRCE